jgi:hypothetical protein
MFMAVNNAEPTWTYQSAFFRGLQMRTYKGKEVGKVVPPKVGARQNPRNDPEHHGDDGQADKHRIEWDEATVGLHRAVAHVCGEVPGGCSISVCGP